MKKLMMILVALVATFTSTAADFTFSELYAAAEIVSSNKLASTSADVKKAAKKDLETAKEMKEAYKVAGFSNFTVSNANHVVRSRYIRGKRIHIEKPSIFASAEKKATVKSVNDMMLKGIEIEKDNNVKLELLLEYKLEKFDL